MQTNWQAQACPRVQEHSHWVLSIEQALGQYGLALSHSNLAHNLTSNELPPSQFTEQASCNLVWTEAVRMSGDDLLGMRLPRVFSPTVFKLLQLAAVACPTAGAAIQLLQRFSQILSTQIKLEISQELNELHLHLSAVGAPHQQHFEAVLSHIVQLLSELDLVGNGLLKRAVLRRPVDELEACHRLLNCDQLVTGKQYSLTVPTALLEQPLATSDSFILARLSDTLQEMLTRLPAHDLVEQVKRRIQLLLGSGDISVERITSPLNISDRHLRRKLSQEGTSYEQLVDEVRRETAIRMIGEGQLTLTSIAYELGFLDPSSFTRAFRRWTNMSPTVFRQQLAAGSVAPLTTKQSDLPST